jgi:hypothetical protein
MPDSPSTMMSRASSAVGAMMLQYVKPSCTHCRIHSAPALDFPKPLPAQISQVRHSPDGGSCAGRAQNFQL